MKRLPDWDSRLGAYLISCRDKPYHPALFNCGIFVAGAIHAQTGEDITARYTPADGSYSDFCHWLAAQLGFREVTPLAAMRGDPVAADPVEGSDIDLALGLCIGAHALFFDHTGLRAPLLADCRKGWSI